MGKKAVLGDVLGDSINENAEFSRTFISDNYSG